jgi:hypothetical protein|nr:hypothetical protein [Neorhizobium tomejilense]
MQGDEIQDIKDCLMSAAIDERVLRRALRAASAQLGDMVTRSVGSAADTYVAGINYDFDRFARHYALSLGERLVGVACFSSVPMRYLAPGGERMFSSGRLNFAEAPDRPPGVAVIFLAVASDELEIVNLISMVSQKTEAAKIIIACGLAAKDVGEATEQWLDLYDLPKPEIVALSTHSGDLRSVRDRVYEALDDRPMKAAPLMPIWIMERAFGPMPEHMREQYALRD